MKIVIGFIVLVVLLGGIYGLAKFGIIKTQKLADKSPLAAKVFMALKLAKPHPKMTKVAVSITPTALTPADSAAQAELARERAEIAQEKATLDTKLQEASMTVKATPPPPPSNPILPTSPKLIAIYEAMDSEDLVKIFAKEPDSAVVSALAAMDEKKAGERTGASSRRARRESHGASEPGHGHGPANPSTRRVFSRARSPLMSVIRDLAIPSASATASRHAPFAAPSTGGALHRTCRTPFSNALICVLAARGVTRMCSKRGSSGVIAARSSRT